MVALQTRGTPNHRERTRDIPTEGAAQNSLSIGPSFLGHSINFSEFCFASCLTGDPAPSLGVRPNGVCPRLRFIGG